MLESQIEALTVAVNRLADALIARATQPYVPAAPMESPTAKLRPKKAPAAEPAPPAAAPAAAAPAAAPAAAEPALTLAPTPSPTAPKADPKLLLKMTEAVIRLANEHDHEAAIAILAKRKVRRCSEVPEGEWQAVLDEAEEATAKAQAAAATTSLV